MQETFNVIEQIINQKYFWELSGTLLALIFLLLIWRALFGNKSKREIIAYDSGNGFVTVSASAISDLIQKAADRTGGIQKCIVKLKPRRDTLNITLKIHLRANSRLREIENNLRITITEALSKTLGIDNLGRLDIKVTGFAGSPKPVIEKETSTSEYSSTAYTSAPSLSDQTIIPEDKPNRMEEDKEK